MRSLDIWRMLATRRSNDRLPSMLIVACVATAVLVVVLVAGANTGLARRDARVAWRTPVSNPIPVAVEAADPGTIDSARLLTVTEYRAGHQIVTTHYGPRAEAPVPPGLDRLPQPGEVFLSPAAARLVNDSPDLFSAAYRDPTGVVGDDGLASPDELAVVVGRAPDDPIFSGPPQVPAHRADEGSGPVTITSLATTSSNGSEIKLYQALAAIGSVMLLVPAAAMIGGAVRMQTTRRSIEYATLRLAGASTNHIRNLALVDGVWVTVLGLVVGLALAVPALAGLTPVQVAGGSWFLSDLLPSPLVMIAVAVAVLSLSVFSTLGALRRVDIDPLGVVTNAQPGRAGWLRFVALGAAVALFVPTMRSSEASTFAISVAWAGLIGATYLIGPLLVRLLGSVWIRTARSASGVLSARRLLDDPRGAYRQIGGLALAGFVAGLFVSIGALQGTIEGDDATIGFGLPSETPVEQVDELQRNLAGIAASFEFGRGERFPHSVSATLEPGATVDELRAVVSASFPNAVVASEADTSLSLTRTLGDFRRASLMALIVSGLAAAVGTGSQIVSAIIDQRQALTALRLAGIPARTLAASRKLAVVVPVVIATAASTLFGAWAGLFFADETVLSAPFGLLMAISAGAVALVMMTELLSRPLLRRYTSDRTVLAP